MDHEARAASRVEHVLAAVYVALVLADALIVVDVLAAGALHRWAARRARWAYRSVAGPVQHEAEIRRQAAWVVWEAMQLLEEGATP